jgi:N-acetylneuraminic acid mutarotase
MFKMRQLFLYLFILTINLLLLHCGGGDLAGGSEVWGRVASAEISGVPDVTVKLYQNDGEYLKDSAIEITTTDKNGIYYFNDIKPGSYAISGIDRLSKQVFFRTNIDYNSVSVELCDTLKLAGELLLRFKGMGDVSLTGIVGFIPGTPYFNFVEYDSLLIVNMAPGSYECKVAVQTVGFLPVITSRFQIEPGKKTIIEIILENDPSKELPVPKNLALEGIIDTLSGKAILKWDTVKVSDLKGYQIYRGTHPDSITSLVRSTKNTFDTVDLVVDTTGKSINNYFQVRSVDTLGNLSYVGSYVTVSAPSPLTVKTIISDTLIGTHGSLYMGDTAVIVITGKNGGRLIDSITWAIGKQDSVILKKACGGVHQFVDTMKFVWKDSLAKTWYISAVDNSGAVVTVVKRVVGSGMYPPDTWQILPAKLSMGRQFLTVVTDGIKIYTFGGYQETIDLRSHIKKRKPFDLIESFCPDSNSSFITGKMKISRYSHSSVFYNGKIYSIGGDSPSNKVFSIEVYDPVTQQSTIIGTLPYIRFGSSVLVVGNEIIMVGGSIISDTISMRSYVTGSIDEINISTAQQGKIEVHHLGDLLIPRSDHSAVVYNDQIIVMGGLDTNSSSSLANVECFNPVANTHALLPDLKVPRCQFSTAVVNEKLFVFGGCVTDTKYLNSVEALDLENPSGWQILHNMAKARYGMATVVHNGKIFMMGGTVINNDGSTETDTTINIYYP